MSALRDELKEQFVEIIGVDIEEAGLLDACVSVCSKYGLSAEDLATKWDVFSGSGSGAKFERKALTMATFEEFHAKQLNKLRMSMPQFLSKSGRASRVTKDSLSQLDARKRTREHGADASYGTPAGAAGARGGESEEAGSPLTAGPSAQYIERKNAGKVETTLNADVGARGAAPVRGSPLEVDAAVWDASAGFGRHMWERLEDKAAALDRHAHVLGAAICASARLDPPGNVVRATVDEMTAVGRIVCDSEGKVNSQSAYLETTRASSAGVRVKLDLTDVPDFILFRGQVVAVRGTNARGNALAVRQILSASPRAPPRAGDAGVRVLIASGPYTTDDSLTYAPLHDLLAAAERHSAECLILLGPFVDEAHPHVRAAKIGELTYELLFRARVVDVLHDWLAKQRAAGRAAPTIVLVPSCADVHAHPTFPQAPLDARGTAKTDPSLISVRNPATISIGGYAFALCAADAVKALGAEECARVSLPPSQREDRMTRLCRQAIEQRVFMPPYPPPKEVAVDTTLALGPVGAMPVTPHVLIVASELSCFAKVACGVVCVNPGRLVKHMHGGTYALVHIHPSDSNATPNAQPTPTPTANALGDAPSARAAEADGHGAVKAPSGTEEEDESTSIASRTCVQIVRI